MDFKSKAEDLSYHILRKNSLPKWDREVVEDIEQTIRKVWNMAIEAAAEEVDDAYDAEWHGIRDLKVK